MDTLSFPVSRLASKQRRGLQVQALGAGRGDAQVYCIKSEDLRVVPEFLNPS